MRPRPQSSWPSLAIAFATAACCLQTHAQTSCAPVVGSFTSVQGTVEVQDATSATWYPANLSTTLCQGASVRVGDQGRAAVSLVNDAVLRIDQNTTVRLVDVVEEAQERSILDVVTGIFQSFSREPRRFAINTPYVNGSIEGTEYQVRVFADRADFTVFEGTVAVANTMGSMTLEAGQSAAAAVGQAPQRRTVVNPTQEVQWALYYPTVLSAGASANPDLRQAAEHLSVGRVDEARASIDQALSGGRTDALALALRAVIAVAQNDNQQALADATQAVNAAPRSVPPAIALSYAQQANFQIEEAVALMRSATQNNANDALAWARLAELELMLGNRTASREAAERAASIAPNIARTRVVQGFAALAVFDDTAAHTAFSTAIDLDSADPLAHLGLGLAKISRGDLADGRSDLEAAVALDSNNALLRAYLGKAYFEEVRPPLDSQQYEMAKQLDPNDPTPFLYAAIAKQTQNKPVDALRDLQLARAKNDNRAVYRGRLLLDKDRAASGTSLARVHNDLGFSQLGIIEATRSAAIDPANASAHRFLSDSYRNVPRREIARVSELLQAQMMQDTNINPVQPSLSETNLNIVTLGGPADPGFNEFTPLFERNQFQFNATGFAGSNKTFGGEGVASAVYDRLSVSAGAFYYETDGFRENNDLQHEIFNVFAQYALSPALNVQAEVRRRESSSGDIVMKFDPEDFFGDLRRDFEEDSARVGVRYSPNESSDLLLSFIITDREEEGRVTQTLDFGGGFLADLFTQTFTEEEATQTEAQYIYQNPRFNLTAGVAYAEIEQEIILEQSLDFGFGPFPFPTFTDAPEIEDFRGYVYANVNVTSAFTLTFGVSYQDYEEEAFEVDSVNPKAGFRWNITDTLALRGSYFEVIKPALASNRTLEPTQLAGFTQFYDDANATETEQFAGGIDWQASDSVFVGAEYTQREFDQPVFIGADVIFEEREESLIRGYAYWTPTTQLSISLEAMYDEYETDDDAINPELPREVETFTVPLQVQFFHPSGFFAGAKVSYVDQEVERSLFAMQASGTSDFVTADLVVGYRFLRRQGIVSIAVQNLFDESFEFQDDSFRQFQDEPTVAPYTPETAVMVRMTFNF